jgi:hypothetical protein
MMVNITDTIELSIIEEKKLLVFNYISLTERTIYDICDMQGRILFTSPITELTTQVDVSGFISGQYILLILDGDKVCSKKFRL